MSSTPIDPRCEELISFFHRAPLRSAFGMNISYNSNREAQFVMPYNASFDHTMGGIYGGVIASMIDNAGWFTAAAHTDNWVSTTNLDLQILQPAEKTLIRSQGRLVRAGKSISVVTVEVHTESGSLIAIGTGTFAISSIPRVAIK